MWGANLTKTEGFETKAPSTTYNSTVTISEAESDCGIGWSIFYGTVSTNDKISGSNSAQMRYYSSSDNRGYVQSTTAVDGLSNVAFKARVSNVDMKLTVSCSADGSAWTALATNVAFEQAGAQGVKTLNYDIPSGGKYIKFEVAEGSTKPSSGNIKLIIDSVVFTYAEPVEPVVLPDTLDVSNVSFRSEGMPDYVITEGDTAGTYFDMGAHDSSNDTALYAEWDVTIQPVKYNIAVDVYNTNSWTVQILLLNQAGTVVKTLDYHGHSGDKGQFSAGSMDLRDLEAGDYKVRAHSIYAWSALKVKDIIFAADYQGVSVDLPGTLLPAYAELSAGASVANNAIAFAPATANTEYAIWNVSFAEAGNYNVSIDMTASNGHTYGVALLSEDGTTEVDAVAEAQAWDTGVKELGTITVPAAGNYQVKLTNATQWSEAVINSITIAAPIGGPVYYLVGTMNEWTPAEAYKFEENPGTEGEYMLTAALAVGDSLKVLGIVGATQTWYPDNAANYGIDAAHAGESKKIYFRPNADGGEGWYHGVIFVEENQEPAGCDWDNIEFLGSTDAQYTNQFKVCVASELDPQVVNIQQGFGDEIGIYCQGFANADFQSISVPEGKYSVQGAGIIFHISYFTAKETEVEVICGGGGHFVYQFTVLNVNGEEPAINYSLKNNWGAVEEWTWKEMTKDGDNYKLENVVFGGTGVNYKADLLGAPELWVPMADFLGDKVDAKDTVTFVLNPADSTITATLIGKYIEPQPEMTVIYNWAKDSADQVGATIFGGNSNITTGTVKIHENTDDVNGIKFGSSYVYADGKWIAIKPAEGGFKAGDILSVSVVFNNSDATKYCMVDLRAADGDTRIWMSDSLSTLNGRNAGEPIVQTYTLEADQDSLFLGRYGNTGMFVTLLKVDRAVAPEPVHTYTVAGAPATLFGQEWAPSYAANDLEPIVGGEYTHGWKKDSVALAAGKVEFKIVEDHAWAHAWPAQNYVLNIPEAGLYNITILFNQYAEADSLRILATADKVGEAVVIPTVVMHGTFTNPNWATTDPFTLAADSLTASLKLNLEAKTYEFGMKFDGVWKANGANITREAPSACLATGDGNMHMTADQAGEYTFTYTFATQTLEVAYPKIIKHYGVAEAIAAAADSVLVKDDLVYIRGIVTKIEFKGKNFAKYGSACIYVADAAGAADTLEFYNCYSMNADTFKTSDPAYDATSTAWAQFNSVSDANGNTVALGDVVEAFGKYNLYNGVHQLNQGCYITEIRKPSVAPTTAPAAPTQAEEDVMAIYCNHYATNNLHFEILGWGGVTTWHADTIDGVAIVYCQDMKYEFLTNWGAASYDMSAYKKLHADLWAPAASTIRLGIEALGVNDGGSGFKSGVVCTLAEGWNSIDIEFSQVPDLANYSFTDVKYIFFEWYKTPEGESFENNPFGFANIYFYDKKAEGFENIDASVKAVKVLLNGQIFILRGDKIYTVTGQPIAK